MTKGIITDIQRFCVHDGPGVRTLVFLKGCHLNCFWCHNPETKKLFPQIKYLKRYCTSCGACAVLCPECHSIENGSHIFDNRKCRYCLQCKDVCLYNALSDYGKEMSAADVVTEALKDRVFYGSEGGVTLSGGEPLCQYEFTLEILTECKAEGLNTCVETSGMYSDGINGKLGMVTDYICFDIKDTDAERLKKNTGAERETILKNLYELDKSGIPLELRCIILKDVNDTEAHIKGVLETADRLKNLREITLLPYNSYGNAKLGFIGEEWNVKKYDFTPEDKKIKSFREIIKKYKIERGF